MDQISTMNSTIHNNTSISKSSDTKTALKLLNQYAEGYHALKFENKMLISEMNDLRTNLKINKNIISSFLAKISLPQQTQTLISNLQNEINTLTSSISLLQKDNVSLLTKQTQFQNEIDFLKSTLEKKDNQIFILEQSLIKHENNIQAYKKKIRGKESKFIVLEPSQAVIKLNDELLTYKEIYKRVSKYLKRNCERIHKYENIITDLQTKNGKLRTQNKLQIYSANREKEHLLYQFKEELYLTQKSNPNYVNNNNYGVSSRKNGNSKSFINSIPKERKTILIGSTFEDKILKKLSMKNDNDNNNNINTLSQNTEYDYTNRTPPNPRYTFNNEESFKEEKFEDEEFEDVLKMAGISIESYISMSKNKLFSKLTDAIEFMYKLVSEKNMCIRLLEIENGNLNAKNYELNKENMELRNEYKRRSGLGDSMINNTSQIMINNLNIHTTPRKINENNIHVTSNSTNRRNRFYSGDNNERMFDEKNNEPNMNVDNKQMFIGDSITSSELKQECNQFCSFASVEEDQIITNKRIIKE